MRDGVAPSYLYLPEGTWSDMISFLVERFPDVPEAAWRDRMARGDVVDGEGNSLQPDSRFKRGLRIFYYRELDAPETPIPFKEEILHMDQHLVVVDKPHFLPMTPTGRFLHETLLTRLKKTLGEQDLTPIHRLDRETAGVVIFSRNAASRGTYQSMFQKRVIDKEYEALAPRLHGVEFPLVHRSRMVDGDKFFIMKEQAGEPNSATTIEVIAHRADCTHYRLFPHTGRKHQLRLHLASLGIPILNDAFYPVALPCKQDDMTQPLQLLARAISFIDPISGEWREFRSHRTLQQ
jgi:tRNA pseudouridine32 synthase/23S rRNA pseudouridine746 synthase